MTLPDPHVLRREHPLAAFATELDPFAKDQYAFAMYSDPRGSRVRIAADLDLKGAKRLARRLQIRIRKLEEEEEAGGGADEPRATSALGALQTHVEALAGTASQTALVTGPRLGGRL
jgi:hypothetical protein